MEFKKGSVVGVFGARGSGKTFLTRKIVESLPENVIVFDTIGVLKCKNVKFYKIDPRQEFNKQIAIFSGVVLGTSKNVGVNLSNLTK